MSKTYLIICLLAQVLYLSSGCTSDPILHLQGISPVNDQVFKELDALQLSSGTILMAGMHRTASGIPEYGVTVYRSTDVGLTWQTVFSLQDTVRDTRQYADPRLTVDPNSGKIYLVLMQVRLPKKANPSNIYRRDYYLGDIAVYSSEDEGEHWSYQSSPHIDPTGAYGDLPFPIVDRQGCLWIFHSRLDLRRLIAPSEIVLHRSCDGGRSWEYTYTLSDTAIADSRKNLGNLVVFDDHTLAGTFTDQQQLYYFELDYQQEGLLKNLNKIPLQFGGLNIPIAYLYRQATTGQLGIISYLPHKRNSAIWYSGSSDGGRQWISSRISERGAYPNVLIDPGGQILITFNRLEKENFMLMHTYSQGSGQDFGQATALYQAPYRFTENGEYQALFRGNDGLKHLIFCDWSDYSRAKHGVLNMKH